jgi:plastocyanin
MIARIGMAATLLALIAACEVAAAAALSVTVLQENGKPLPGAVVTVHSLDGAAKPSPPIHAVMDQVNQTFTPDLLVIPIGSTVSFPNSDTTSHEVYSFSPAHPFQLPLYRGKPYPPEHFNKVGLVTLGCNIHDFMLAYILVTDAQFYGRADARGVWSAPEVPRGRYRIEIWHPRFAGGANPTREVAVSDAEPAAISVRLGQPLRPAPLGERLPSWDSY